MSVFSIRKAKPEDNGLIFKFIKDLAQYENMEDCVETTEEMLFDSLFVKNAAEVLIAQENGEPVGYALYFFNFSTFSGRRGLYLEDLYISPEYRAKGYGKAIFVYLAQLAGEAGCARMEWVCLDWNTPSQRFYRSIGAQQQSQWIIHRLDKDGIHKLAETAGE